MPITRKIKSKFCAICAKEFIPSMTNRKFCVNCSFTLPKKPPKTPKTPQVKPKVKKKTKSMAKYKEDLQTVFNRFIRLRDQNETCISCGTNYSSPHWHAGHYQAVGTHPELRFNEDNVHKQCARCNMFLHGNLIYYRKNLLAKIGQERLNKLEEYYPLTRLTIPDIEELLALYNKKISAIQSNLV